MDKLSYALGHNIGHQLIGMGLQKSLNIEDYTAAIAVRRSASGAV